MVFYGSSLLVMALRCRLLPWIGLAERAVSTYKLQLLLALAWQAPGLTSAGYLIILGLLATLVGAVFLSHVLYTIDFASRMTLAIF